MKMACDTIIDLVSLYKDGTASETTKKLINEHLKECPECRHYYRCYRNVDFIKPKSDTTERQDGETDAKYENLSKMLQKKKRNEQIINSFISATLMALTAFACLGIAKRIYRKMEK